MLKSFTSRSPSKYYSDDISDLLVLSFCRNQKGEFSSRQVGLSFVDRNTNIYQSCFKHTMFTLCQLSIEPNSPLTAATVPFNLTELQLFDQH